MPIRMPALTLFVLGLLISVSVMAHAFANGVGAGLRNRVPLHKHLFIEDYKYATEIANMGDGATVGCFIFLPLFVAVLFVSPARRQWWPNGIALLVFASVIVYFIAHRLLHRDICG